MSSGHTFPKSAADLSLWARLTATPMRDLLRARLTARQDLRLAVAFADLPPALAGRAIGVARRSKLWREEQIDVASELAQHFRDGLDAGRTAEELLLDFGDERTTARLIRRAKQRGRPLWWRAYRAATWALAIALGAVAVVYLLLVARFAVGSPTVSRDYLAELNRPILAVPEPERAWPLYRQALLSVLATAETVPDADPLQRVDLTSQRPGGTHWAQASAAVRSLAPAFALVREAAGRSAMGKPMSFEVDAELQRLSEPPGQHLSPAVKTGDLLDQALVGVLMPELSWVRKLARWMALDTRVAVEDGDGARVAGNLEAMIALAEHVRGSPTLIAELVSMAVFSLAAETLQDVLEGSPDLLLQDQWVQLAHRVGGYAGGGAFPMSFAGEQAFFEDFLQRTFTDDGRGDGRLASNWGTTYATLVSSLNTQSALRTSAATLVGPAAAALIGSRAENSRAFAELVSAARTWAATPVWLRVGPSPSDRLDALRSQGLTRMHLQPVQILAVSFDQAVNAADCVTVTRDATALAIALELHRRRTGAWPASLSELPATLKARVPADPADGRPIRYRLEAGRPVLYSLGADRIDQGGTPATSADGSRAATNFRLPPASPPPGPREVRGVSGDWVLYPPSVLRAPAP